MQSLILPLVSACRRQNCSLPLEIAKWILKLVLPPSSSGSLQVICKKFDWITFKQEPYFPANNFSFSEHTYREIKKRFPNYIVPSESSVFTGGFPHKVLPSSSRLLIPTSSFLKSKIVKLSFDNQHKNIDEKNDSPSRNTNPSKLSSKASQELLLINRNYNTTHNIQSKLLTPTKACLAKKREKVSSPTSFFKSSKYSLPLNRSPSPMKLNTAANKSNTTISKSEYLNEKNVFRPTKATT